MPRSILTTVSNNFTSIKNANKTRFIILIVSMLILIFSTADSMLFNFTVICMTENVNGTYVELFDLNEKGMLYTALAIGTLISCLIIMELVRKIGGRRTFTIYGFITGLATILFPVATGYGVYPVTILRFMQGIGNGMMFAVVGYVAAAWSPIKSSGVFLVALTSYNQLAPMITMPLSGALCTSDIGWQGVYYVMGILTFLVFILFYVVYTDRPHIHGHVSDKEVAIIDHRKSSITVEENEHHPPIPYCKMIKDLSVIGTLIACFGDFVCFNIFILFAPVYLNKVLGLDIAKTGMMSAIPHIGSLIVKVIVGPLSDSLTMISTKLNVRIFMCISQLSMTFCLISLAVIPTDWVFIAQILYFIALVLTSCSSVGYFKAAKLSCGPFVSTTMSWFTIIYAVILIFLPIFKTLFAGEDSPDQWRMIFYIAAAICFITLVIWFFTVEVELRPWANEQPERNNNRLLFVPRNKSYQVSPVV